MAGGMPNPRKPLEAKKKQRKYVILWQTFIRHTFPSSAIYHKNNWEHPEHKWSDYLCCCMIDNVAIHCL
jgi:hypothetical protein